MKLPPGVWVALPTPFDNAGKVDHPALRAVVHHVVQGGVDVLVPLGTTGEAATLDDDERDAVIGTCRAAAPALPLVVGCGSPATHRAAAFVRRARALGADGALVVTPYYNKPTQEGLVAHYQALATAAPGFPLVAYDVPSRTGVSIALPTLERLWQIPQLVGLKESSGNVARYRDILRTLPPDKLLLCGDDHLAVAGIAAGARGLVSVLANVAPAPTVALVRAACEGDTARAQSLLDRLLPLAQALFLESNPIPLKAALQVLGLATPVVRLPLTSAQGTTVSALRSALDRLHEPAGATP